MENFTRNLFPRFTRKTAEGRHDHHHDDDDKRPFQKSHHHHHLHHLHITKPHRKIVILIGCEYVKYDELGILHRLPGCHVDLKNMQDMLISHYGYDYSDFIILSDEKDDFTQPTRLNIMEILEKIIQYTDLSQIVVYYSGHGTRTKDKFYKRQQQHQHSQERTTRMTRTINIQKYLKTLYTFEDCIVPCDYLEAGLISDTCFQTHFWSKIPIWTRVTAIFDSCNSGSIFNLPFRYQGEDTLERDTDDIKLHQQNSSAGAAPIPFIITISGCRNDQKSVAVSQMEQYTTSHSGWEGCMSFAFREVLKSHHFAPIGLNTLIDEMRALLSHRNFSQIPQLSMSHDVLPSSIVQIF